MKTGRRAGILAVMLLAMVWPLAGRATGPEGAGEPAAVHARLTFGRDVDRATRTVVQPAGEFPATVGKVYCLARVTGALAPTTVTFVWYREGRTMARVELPVRSADFRTWSSKRIMPAWTGSWEVKVLDDQGMVLGEAAFAVTGSDDDDH